MNLRSLRGYTLATLAVILALAAARLLHTLLPPANLSLVFITAVLITAGRTGLAPAIYASLASLLVYNFFFTPPYHSLRIDDPDDISTLAFYLITAALTAKLASRMREQTETARVNERRTENLYAFSRRLAAAAGLDQVLDAVAEHTANRLRCHSAVLLPDRSGVPEVRAHSGVQANDCALAEAAMDAWRTDKPMPRTDSGWEMQPLNGADGRIGLLALRFAASATPDAEERQLIDALCDQAAVAIERALLAADLEETRVLSETEQLRSALLSSVSHDLRTPLSSIIGATSSLIAYGESFSPENRQELLGTVLDEAERLNRYIQNLLDMTRLGHGALKLQRDWTDLNDIVSSAVARLSKPLEPLQVVIEIAPGVPLLHVHAALIEQVLVNLLDNAAKHSPAGGTIAVRARLDDESVEIDVLDQGPGIPEAERERIFDMFYSVTRGDRQTHGSGLGLAICLGLVGAHGGAIHAESGDGGRGTCMRVTLPAPPPPPGAGDD